MAYPSPGDGKRDAFHFTPDELGDTELLVARKLEWGASPQGTESRCARSAAQGTGNEVSCFRVCATWICLARSFFFFQIVGKWIKFLGVVFPNNNFFGALSRRIL